MNPVTITWKERRAMKMIPVRKLVLDHAVYPRSYVNFEHVQRLIDTIEAGTPLPPVIICRETRRIVDGAHRTRAVDIITDHRGDVACIEKVYDDDRALFLDAVRYNSEHGLALSPADRCRILERASELKIDQKLTTAALRMTATAVGALTVKPITSLSELRKPALAPRSKWIEPPPEPTAVRKCETTPPAKRPTGPDLIDLFLHFLEEGEINPDDTEVVHRLNRIAELIVSFELHDPDEPKAKPAAVVLPKRAKPPAGAGYLYH